MAKSRMTGSRENGLFKSRMARLREELLVEEKYD